MKKTNIGKVRNNPIALAYKVTHSTSLGNPDLPKNASGTGVTNLVNKAKSPLPIKQSGMKHTKYGTGDFWSQYTKRNQQNVSDLKTQEKAKTLPSYTFLTGAYDSNTKESTKQVNDAVARTSIESGAKKAVHGKVVKTAKNEQSIISLNTKNGVITLPKTYDLKTVAHHFGVSTESEKPSVLRHKIQRAIDRHPEDAGVKKGLEAMHKFRIGYSTEIRKLDQAEILNAQQVLKDKEVSDSRIKKNEAKFIERNIRTVQGGEDKLQTKADILSGKKSMTIVKNDESGQPIYSNTIKPASDSERAVVYDKDTRKPRVIHTGNPNPLNKTISARDTYPYITAKKEIEDLSSKVSSAPEQSSFEKHADIVTNNSEYRKKPEFYISKMKDGDLYKDYINAKPTKFAGSKSHSLLTSSIGVSPSLKSIATKELNSKMNELNKQFPENATVSGIEASAPQFSGGHKAFFDLSGIKAAEDSGVGLDKAIKEFERKSTLSLNANNAKKKSQQQMNVTMQSISGDEVRSTPGALKQLMKATSIVRPKKAITSSDVLSHNKIGLQQTILNEDTAEHGKLKIQHPHDTPFGGEVYRRFAKKSSKR